MWTQVGPNFQKRTLLIRAEGWCHLVCCVVVVFHFLTIFCLGFYNGKLFGLTPNFLKSLLLLGGEGGGSKSKLAFHHQSHKVKYFSQFGNWFFFFLFCVSSLFFLCFPQLDGCLPSWLSLCLCVEYWEVSGKKKKNLFFFFCTITFDFYTCSCLIWPSAAGSSKMRKHHCVPRRWRRPASGLSDQLSEKRDW